MKNVSGVLLFFFSLSVFAESRSFILHVEQFPSLLYSVDIRVGIYEPARTPIGDVLYLHGFGDRYDNHEPLFAEWTKRGFRVIAFDLPSHGLTKGTSIDSFGFTRLGKLVMAVEAATREDQQRLLVLSGWSTGGLLAVRMMQTQSELLTTRIVAGLILFAPGIYVRNIVGEPSLRYPLGEITGPSLTHDPNPPHYRSPKPKSPGSKIIFAALLKYNSWLAELQDYPKNIQTLILTGDEDSDRYARTDNLQFWIARNQTQGARIIDVHFHGARHEIDNETEEFGGPEARAMAGKFASDLLNTVSGSILGRP